MRILALNLCEPYDLTAKDIQSFCLLSPRVQYRSPGLIFIDISDTSHLLGGEQNCISRAQQILWRIHPKLSNSSMAIAKTPYSAQILAKHKPMSISPLEDELGFLKDLPLQALQDLEGLIPWSKPRQLQSIIDFFNYLGLYCLEDLYSLSPNSFRERWSDLGTTLWKRLHLGEEQKISPLPIKEPLVSYHHFDFSVSFRPMLMASFKEMLTQLFARLQSLSRYSESIVVYLHCEFSRIQHSIEIQPVTPSRDLNLFLDLFEKKIEKLDLDNPIKEIEVLIHDVPEKVLQLDMFEPRDHQQEKWIRLISFARQSNIEMGFLQLTEEPIPEESFYLKTDLPLELKFEDLVLRKDEAIQVKTVHAKTLQNSPRPTIILAKAKLLRKEDLSKIRFFLSSAIERLSSTWWRLAKKQEGRDYYIGLYDNRDLWWIYKDLHTQEYFLQGYFD